MRFHCRWGGFNKAAAANLTRQQEQFCSSIKDIDDSETGWGDVDERVESTKVCSTVEIYRSHLVVDLCFIQFFSQFPTLYST